MGAELPYAYGDYFLEVSSIADATGHYRLSREGGDVADHINSWVPIGTGGEVTSSINRTLDQDYFRLKLAAENSYRITAEPDFDAQEPASAIDIVVLGEDQNTLYEANGQAGLATIIDTDGTDSAQTVFIIVRRGLGAQPEGRYKLRVRNLSNENLCAL